MVYHNLFLHIQLHTNAKYAAHEHTHSLDYHTDEAGACCNKLCCAV